jgi:hypothetical protein
MPVDAIAEFERSGNAGYYAIKVLSNDTAS